jgi:hypothetical protein
MKERLCGVQRPFFDIIIRPNCGKSFESVILEIKLIAVRLISLVSE